MLFYPLPALVTPFPGTFLIKGNDNNGKNPSSWPFSALMTPFPAIAFTSEEATSCINEEVGGVIRALRNPSSCLYISCFTV